ncbi:uncharacterized protein LOC126656490 [Mercurialis annua]|uniref:uncharacterized protein LOC126656490 n=1 Tax=Mercurialis annua TaxID=3986 RepID=UPI0021602E57|nr:uncharacterized protein LOC126656490 [Mercurialis annua]
MGPDLEKSKANTIGILANNKDNQDKNHNCNFNEQQGGATGAALEEDIEVNVVECTKSCYASGQLEARCEQDEDGTESMSSFGDTISDNENENGSLFGEVEVNSQFCDGDVSLFDGFDGALPMRRKKLTDHWRRFIRPLMWRCKWIELQIKEFQSQALKYDRELAEHAQRKQFDFDTFLVEGFDTKSLPFSSCTQRKKVMKRKKRNRVEEMVDIKSHMLQHNLFSYYEIRKPPGNGALMTDDCDNLGKAVNANDELEFQDGWTSLESKPEDNIQENILLKIELLQLQVRKLKARIEKVVSDNPGRFSSVNMLSMPASGDALTSSDQNIASSSEDDDGMHVRSLCTLSPHRSDFNTRDLIPDSVVSSHGEVAPLPDMIKSTNQMLVGMSGEKTAEEILIHNKAAKEEMHNFEIIDSQHPEKGQEPMEKDTVQVSEENKSTETFLPRANFGEKTLPKSRSTVSDNKRTRGRRKTRRGGWSRRS